METLIVIEYEVRNDRHIGQAFDMSCLQGGKVVRLQCRLDEDGLNLGGTSFYNDSLNNLPLLEKVNRPAAVDPDPRPHAEVEKCGWPIISPR